MLITRRKWDSAALNIVELKLKLKLIVKREWVSRSRVAGVAAMQFYARSTDVSAEMEEMNAEGKKVTAAGSEGDTGPTTVNKLFTDPDLRKPLFIACALAVIQQFSGINAVRRFSCHWLSLLTQSTENVSCDDATEITWL